MFHKNAFFIRMESFLLFHQAERRATAAMSVRLNKINWVMECETMLLIIDFSVQ